MSKRTRTRFTLFLALALLAGAALVTVSQAAPTDTPLVQSGAPRVISYQGEVCVSDSPYDGKGYFKFAVVDAAGKTTYWSNDGSSSGGGEPSEAVQLDVSDGLFGVLLGDTTLSGMTRPLRAAVFDGTERYLRVWFGTSGAGSFEQLTPDTRVAAAPYAMQAEEAANADTVDGLHASELADYENVVIVAKSGGDYTSVQVAMDSIADAAADNAYLVWVAPGVYSETVTMKPHVHLQGAGQEATVITSTASSGDYPPTQGTLVLTRSASLRDLTVVNGGAGTANAALLATAGTTRTLAADVTARAQGGDTYNYAIFLTGIDTGIILQDVTALGENGSNYNYGLFNGNGAATTLRGGSYTGRGGESARGIYNSGGSTTLEAESVTVLGENSSDENVGLSNFRATATLRGGSYTGRGGQTARGISNSSDGATLEAESVTALGENGSNYNYGLFNGSSGAATLRGGSYTGRGGESAWGISNSHGATLEAKSVSALGENGSNENHGLRNYYGTATADNSQFTGDDYGLYQASGTVYLGVSQLDGGAHVVDSGTLTCFQVYDGNYSNYNCP